MANNSFVIRVFRDNQLNYWLRRVLPWFLAVAFFAYLFITSDWVGVLRALDQVRLFSFLCVLLGYFVVQFVADCLGIAYSLKLFKINIPYGQIFIARGIASLFAMVHYSAGQGALPLYLYRVRQVPLWRIASVVLFLTFIDLYWVIFFSCLGALVIGRSMATFLQATADYLLRIDLILLVGLAVYLILWLVVIPRADLLVWPVKKLLVRLKKSPLFSSFEQASIRTYLRIALARMPVHISMVFFSYLALRTFTSQVPVRVFVLVYTLSLLIAVLPITPAGLGTTQVAVVELLREFASREVLLAYSLLWVVGILALKLLVGVYCLHKGGRKDDAIAGKAGQYMLPN